MSTDPNDIHEGQRGKDEHRRVSGVPGKAVYPYGVQAGAINPLPLQVTDNGDGTGTLVTNASFSGSVTTAPTFKDDPTNSGETPKFGKTNSSTHKQQVEADTSGNDIATQTTLALIKAKTDNIDVALSTRTKPADAQHVIVDSGVTTGLTDTQLRATPVPISGSLTNIAGTISLPTGASTSSLQTTGNSSLSSIDTKLSGTLTTSTTGNVGTTSHAVNVWQTTSNTTRVQLTASSIVSTNGILVQGLSGNVASVFIGDNTVTISTGFELQAGQAVPFTTTNINNLYVIGANGTDGVCWNVL